MFDKILNSPTQNLLSKALDGSALRNQVLANNIANADTPGFKRSEVLFEEKIRQALSKQGQHVKLKATNPRHIQVAETNSSSTYLPDIIMVNDLSYRNDNNNVDIDVETTKIAKNKIYYDAISNSLTQEIRLLRMAITGRS